MTLTLRLLILSLAASLSGCSGMTLSNPFQREEPEAIAPPVLLENEETSAVLEPSDVGASGQSAAALDQTSAADLARAAVVSGGNALGTTVASLGDPTQQGLWLRTPLVSAETPGRVQAANGQSLAVTLIPIAGEASAGSRISLAAMRGLGLGLTDLPTLTVFRVSAAG